MGLWLTYTIVRPSPLSSRIRFMHLRRKGWSPTASTSSIRKMSHSVWTATANASRMNMPDE